MALQHICHLGAADAHDQQAVLFAHERVVQLFHDLGGAHIVGADHHPVRFHEVINGGAFLEEFRVGDHIELQADRAFVQFFLDSSSQLVGGNHRHGGFVHNDLESGHVPADLPGHVEYIFQVG